LEENNKYRKDCQKRINKDGRKEKKKERLKTPRTSEEEKREGRI
jgi:hypothetical protein